MKIIKMSTVPKAIYTFTAISIKTPKKIFVELEES